MSALQGISHTAGGYPERLHYKGAEDKGQYEGRYQPFKNVRNFSDSVFPSRLGGASRSTIFGGLVRGHHKQLFATTDIVLKHAISPARPS
jgi:hypothetical protein